MSASAPAPARSASSLWGLAILPILLLGAVLAYLVATGGGLKELKGPPVEQISIGRITLPERGVIKMNIINDGPEAITIAQVLVDDAFWNFTSDKPGPIPRLGSATLTIPYPWVQDEALVVAAMSSLGSVFEGEIPVATVTPRASSSLFARFGLVGLYVGVVPVLLGMMWYPLLRRLSDNAMNFILSLTVGLLAYLAIGTYLDAQEFAAELPAFWQGTPAVLLIAALSVGLLFAVSGRRSETKPLGVSYRIATGIGLHNLGEGLAIGAAFALGQAALGTFLILGFTLHNITEGVGIVAPLTKKRPPLSQFALLALLAGGPAILGTWIGGFAFNPVLATVFLAIGLGAILQVVWEVGRMVVHNTQKVAAEENSGAVGAGVQGMGGSIAVAGVSKASASVMNWTNLAGFTVGVALMYFTAFLVKF